MKKDLKIEEKTLLFILAASLVSFFAATFLPITLDEAYYLIWAKNLSFGYLDHPPGLALLAAISDPWPRFGALSVGLLSLIMACKLYWESGIRSKQTLLISLLLFKLNFACLAAGILTGPDCFLTFFWLLSLHECLMALRGRQHRWLSAGLATGLGLLSKYTMILIGPIFFYALWAQDRKSLKTKWPYLGGLVALLVFSPNLIWNYQHDWMSFKFQLRRISVLEAPQANSDLPTPKLMPRSGPEWELSEKVKKLDTELSSSKNFFTIPFFESFFWTHYVLFISFILASLGLWGFLLIPLLNSYNKQGAKLFSHSEQISRQAYSLLLASSCFPILFFAGISFLTKVEANWSALYLIGAAPLLAVKLKQSFKKIAFAGLANCSLFILSVIHANTPLFTWDHDRILKETFGFQQLATHIQNLQDPLFADTYQTISMLRYYNPTKSVAQWPGISRPSEFTQNPSFSYSFANLKKQKKFWLITADNTPPVITYFKPNYMERIEDCREGYLLIRTSNDQATINTPCHPVHYWSLIRYIYTEDNLVI